MLFQQSKPHILEAKCNIVLIGIVKVYLLGYGVDSKLNRVLL